MFCQLPCKVSIYNASESVRLARAPDCGSGGRRFETDLPPQKTKGLQQCSPFFYGRYPTVCHQNIDLLTDRLTLKFSFSVDTH